MRSLWAMAALVCLGLGGCGLLPTAAVTPTPRLPAATVQVAVVPTPAVVVPAPPVPPAPPAASANIRVNRPSVGAMSPRQIVVEGEARVFEATVSLRVVDGAGRRLVEGFTTATVGAPEWGSFLSRIEVPLGTSGPVQLQVFWQSPRDGAALDMVSVPLTIVP